MSPPTPHQFPRIQRLRPGLFYGWFVVVAAFLLSFVSVGIGFYGQTVFLDGLIHEKGWSKASVSGASTLFFMTTGFAGVPVGRAVDRWGSRRMLAAGALTMASALLWLGRISEAGQLYLVYPLLAASFAMSAAIPLSGLVNRWFLRQRSRAMSFAQTGVSVGGLVLVPVMTGLIASRGIGYATVVLALLVLVVALPVIAGIVRDNPGDLGLLPDGERPLLPAQPGSPPLAERKWRARDAIRTPTFVSLAASFASILICQTGVAVHHLHLLREHMSTSQAALGAATIPMGSIVGRLIAGGISDRFQKKHVAAALFSIQGIAILALSASATPLPLLAASLLFGLTIGAVFMLQGLLVAEMFGLPSYGTVFGALNFVTGIGGGLGPLTIGLLADSLGGYGPALRVLLVIAPFSAILVARMRAPDA
jgi:MFS family permease